MMYAGRAAGRSLAQIGGDLDIRPDQLCARVRDRANEAPLPVRATGETRSSRITGYAESW